MLQRRSVCLSKLARALPDKTSHHHLSNPQEAIRLCRSRAWIDEMFRDGKQHFRPGRKGVS